MSAEKSMRDGDIRQALLDLLHAKHDSDADSLIIQELGLCQGDARVDIAVINGSIHGFEIKSERDTLDRLPVQQAVYCRTLDHVTVVASERHLEAVEKHVPDWWGLSIAMFLGEQLEIRLVRYNNDNPEIDPTAVVQLLWRDEALEVLTELGLDKGVRTKRRDILWNRLVERLPPEKVLEIVRTKVKGRGDWRSRRSTAGHGKTTSAICCPTNVKW